MIIETPRLLLRPLTESDLDDLVRIYADPEVTRFLNLGKPLSRGDTWRQIALSIGHRQLRGYSMLAIEERGTGKLLGRSGPWFPEGWPMLEVGWVVDAGRRQEGIATEAGRASLAWCFRELGADRVCSIIHPLNVASAGVAARLGAKVEGQLDEFFGQTVDLWVHRPDTLNKD